MFGKNPERRLPPGAHAHDASEIAHLGKIYVVAGAVLASVVESINLVADLVQDDGTGDELIAIGQYGAIGTASYLIFNGLQRHFARRYEEIRSQDVTE